MKRFSSEPIRTLILFSINQSNNKFTDILLAVSKFERMFFNCFGFLSIWKDSFRKHVNKSSCFNQTTYLLIFCWRSIDSNKIERMFFGSFGFLSIWKDPFHNMYVNKSSCFNQTTIYWYFLAVHKQCIKLKECFPFFWFPLITCKQVFFVLFNPLDTSEWNDSWLIKNINVLTLSKYVNDIFFVSGQKFEVTLIACLFAQIVVTYQIPGLSCSNNFLL